MAGGLPVGAAAHAEPVPGARQAVGAEHAHQRARQRGTQVGAVRAFQFEMRPAERRAPVFAQLARRVQFDTARARAVHRHVGLGQAVGQGLADVGLGHVVLAGVEQHQRGVEAAVEMAALEADLAAAAEHRIEEAAVAAAVVLRVEDLGIADERRIHRRDRVDQPGVGHGLAVVVTEHAAVQVVGVVLPAAVAGAHDQRQRLGQRQARGGVRALLVGAQVGDLVGVGRELRVRIATIPLQEVADRRQRLGGVEPRAPGVARTAQAQHQLVLAAPGLERAGRVHIEHVLAAAVAAAVGGGNQRFAGGTVREAIDVEQRHVAVGGAVAGQRPQQPAVAEWVLEIGEGGGGGGVPVAPVRGAAEAARPFQEAAFVVEHRVATPGHALGPVLLIVVAHAQRGGGAEVGIDHAVQHGPLLAVAVQVGIALLVGADQPPAHAAVGRQRRSHIGGTAPAVPCAGAQRRVGLQGAAVGALAHEVDRRRRAAGAAEQAAGPAQHLDAFVDGRIQAGIGGPGVDPRRDRHAVVGHVLDQQAARIEQHPLGIVGVGGHPGDVVEHIAHRGQVLVLDPLRGDDAERLRRLLRGQRQARRRRGLFDRIPARALGLDVDRIKRGRIGGGVRLCRGRQRDAQAGGQRAQTHGSGARMESGHGTPPGCSETQAGGLCGFSRLGLALEHGLRVVKWAKSSRAPPPRRVHRARCKRCLPPTDDATRAACPPVADTLRATAQGIVQKLR